MAKFAVTYVPNSFHSRKRVGKSRVDVINTVQDVRFQVAKSPKQVERVYEIVYSTESDSRKVVDVREV